MTIFGFKKAVKDARLDYPQETKNVAFIDAASPFARLRLHYWFWRTSPTFKKALMAGTKTASAGEAVEYMLKNSFTATRDPVTELGIVVVDTGYKGSMPVANLHYAFDHELGHLVVQNAVEKDMGIRKDTLDDVAAFDEKTAGNNGRETRADVFAALRGIRRKTMDIDDIAVLSTNRALHAYFSHATDHATTKALDALTLKLDETTINSLTPQEIKAIADTHAKEFALTEEDIAQLFMHLYIQPRLLRDASDEICLQALLSTAMKDKTAPAPARLAAHVLNHILDNGRVDFPLSRTFNVAGATFDTLREKLGAHLEASGLGKSIHNARPSKKPVTA